MSRENLSENYEPMDIDTSLNSSRMDVSFSEKDIKEEKRRRRRRVFKSSSKKKKEESSSSDTCDVKNVLNGTFMSSKPTMSEQAGDTKSNIKKYHLARKKQDPYYFLRTKYQFALIVLTVTFVIVFQTSFRCLDEINVQYLKTTFTKRIYGQDRAVGSIISALQNPSPRKVLFLYGGTGVGKTFAISLLLDNLRNYSNVYHYTMPSFENTFSTDWLFGLTVCKSALIVVDDLNRKDMQVNRNVADVLAKSKKLEKNLTMILIFNCDIMKEGFVKRCNKLFVEELRQSFASDEILHAFIEFKSLTDNDLRKCIVSELGTNGDLDVETIMKTFNVSLDGCKGVSSKLKLLLQQHR